MDLEIRRMTAASPALEEAFARLLPQLSGALAPLSRERLQRLAEEPRTALLAALDGTHVVGVLTLVWYDVPSGRKAWIEDVVVDTPDRGRGAGRMLVEAALSLARREGARCVSLTSNPSRAAAHALYRKCGFEEVDTALFRFDFNK